MGYHLHEIEQLAVLLESEAAGLPFDRGHALQLASKLAEHHPEIGNSMRLITERLRGERVGKVH
ncbi:MAG TPA: hypothetical protein VK196_21540 [Magnetospirillum sp.]|nr:hypothetical protein [Magnetospirillum sp.]